MRIEKDELLALLAGPAFKVGKLISLSMDKCLPAYPPKDIKAKPIIKRCRIKVKKEEYTLKTLASPFSSEMGAPPGWMLKVQVRSATNITSIQPFTRLVFAGDLDGDGDGELDFLTDTIDHYNIGTSYSLYLSSKAKKGETMGLVAEFRTGGC